ncbi:hypothetical protein CAP37_19115 [Hydrogenophaga sp. IBVHS1]|nr:hypothetical protein CAP37_19115 [Hydrogenophaga sp. IBVHS1]
MNDIKELREALLHTPDGWSVLLWWLIILLALVRAISFHGILLEQTRYLFFSLIVLLIFIRFRVTGAHRRRMNHWALLGVNCFGIFLIYKELI